MSQYGGIFDESVCISDYLPVVCVVCDVVDCVVVEVVGRPVVDVSSVVSVVPVVDGVVTTTGVEDDGADDMSSSADTTINKQLNYHAVKRNFKRRNSAANKIRLSPIDASLIQLYTMHQSSRIQRSSGSLSLLVDI